MASRLDFAPGLDAQRKREEIDRAKKNARQEDKRTERLGRRAYREALRGRDPSNYMRGMQALESMRAVTGTSGAGISIAGVRDKAISSRFEQTQDQLDNFNGRRTSPLTSGGRATNPDNEYQEGGAFDSLEDSGMNSGVWVDVGGKKEGPVSSALNPRTGYSLGAAPASATRVAEESEAPAPQPSGSQPATAVYSLDALSGGKSPLLSSLVNTPGEQGATGSLISDRRNPVLVAAEKADEERVRVRDSAYAANDTTQKARELKNKIAYRAQRALQADRFDKIIKGEEGVAEYEKSFLGSFLHPPTPKMPAEVPPMDYDNFNPLEHLNLPSSSALDQREAEQMKRFDSVAAKLNRQSLMDSISRDSERILKPLTEELEIRAADAAGVVGFVEDKLDVAEEKILSTKGVGREPLQEFLIKKTPKETSAYIQRQLERERKAKKDKAKR